MSDETGNGVFVLHSVSGCYAEVHISLLSIHVGAHRHHPVRIKGLFHVFLFPTLVAHVSQTEVNRFSFRHSFIILLISSYYYLVRLPMYCQETASCHYRSLSLFAFINAHGEPIRVRCMMAEVGCMMLLLIFT